MSGAAGLWASSIPLLGTTQIAVHAGRALHTVPASIVQASLARHLAGLYGRRWYACILLDDGRGALRGPQPQSPQPPLDIRDRLYSLAVLLNREMHYGGHWVTAWAKGCLCVFWRDADGDLQFEIGFDEPWSRIRHWADTEYAARCQMGFDQWCEQMRIADTRPHETIKLAQGEGPPVIPAA